MRVRRSGSRAPRWPGGRRRQACRTCRRTTCRAGSAQNASATSVGAKRTSSEPWRQAAIRPASRRAADLERRPASPSSARVSSTARSRRASPPRARPTSVIQASSASGSRAERAQHVEGVDVARALPDRVQRRLAVEQRQPGLLDVAVAAEALQRLGDHERGALADPELRQRQRDPAQRRLVRVVAAVDGRGQPHRERGRGLGLDGQVGEHVLHQRLVGQQGAERRAVGDVPGGLVEGAAASATVEPSTQSSRVAATISMIVRTPRPSSPSRCADACRRARARRRRWSGCRACP